HQQVVTDVSDNCIAVDLRPVEYRVMPAVDGHGFAAVDRGLGPVGTVAFVLAVRRVSVGKYTDAPATAADANTDPNAPTAAAVLAAGLLSVRCPCQHNIVLCIQGGVAARFQLAARDHNIATIRAFA